MFIFPFKKNKRKCIRYYRPHGQFTARISGRIDQMRKETQTELFCYENGEVIKMPSVIGIVEMFGSSDPIILIARGANERELLSELYEIFCFWEDRLGAEKKQYGEQFGHPEWMDEPPEIQPLLPYGNNLLDLNQEQVYPRFNAAGGAPEESAENRLPGVKRERRCKKCAEKLTSEMTICPKCGAAFEPDAPYREFDILVRAAMLPEKPFEKAAFVRISNRTSGRDLVKVLLKNNYLRPGQYEEDRILRKETDCSQPLPENLASRWEFCEGDTVFLRRTLDDGEKEQAHLDYVESHYSSFRRNRLYIVEVELHNVGLLSAFCFDSGFSNRRIQVGDPQYKEKRTIQVKAFGMMDKDDIYRLVRQAGYDAGKFSFWPQVTIPFEDGQIQVDALVCELKGMTPIMLPQIYM